MRRAHSGAERAGEQGAQVSGDPAGGTVRRRWASARSLNESGSCPRPTARCPTRRPAADRASAHDAIRPHRPTRRRRTPSVRTGRSAQPTRHVPAPAPQRPAKGKPRSRRPATRQGPLSSELLPRPSISRNARPPAHLPASEPRAVAGPSPSAAAERSGYASMRDRSSVAAELEMNSLRGSHLVAHQQVEDPFGGFRSERLMRRRVRVTRVHRGLGQLVGVHLTQTLVALDGLLVADALALELHELVAQLAVRVRVDVLLLAPSSAGPARCGAAAARRRRPGRPRPWAACSAGTASAADTGCGSRPHRRRSS